MNERLTHTKMKLVIIIGATHATYVFSKLYLKVISSCTDVVYRYAFVCIIISEKLNNYNILFIFNPGTNVVI